MIYSFQARLFVQFYRCWLYYQIPKLQVIASPPVSAHDGFTPDNSCLTIMEVANLIDSLKDTTTELKQFKEQGSFRHQLGIRKHKGGEINTIRGVCRKFPSADKSSLRRVVARYNSVRKFPTIETAFTTRTLKRSNTEWCLSRYEYIVVPLGGRDTWSAKDWGKGVWDVRCDFFLTTRIPARVQKGRKPSNRAVKGSRILYCFNRMANNALWGLVNSNPNKFSPLRHTTSGWQWIFFVYNGDENGGGAWHFPWRFREVDHATEYDQNFFQGCCDWQRVCEVTGVCNTQFPPSLNKLASSYFAQTLVSPRETWLLSFLGRRALLTRAGCFIMVAITFDGLNVGSDLEAQALMLRSRIAESLIFAASNVTKWRELVWNPELKTLMLQSFACLIA